MYELKEAFLIVKVREKNKNKKLPSNFFRQLGILNLYSKGLTSPF